MTPDPPSQPDTEQAGGVVAPPAAASPGFAGVVGQDAALRGLRTAIGQGRLPHGLLFAGPPGVGKATCAALLAEALNCTVAGPADACGQCSSCSKIARGLHPDILWLSPERNAIKIARITPREGGPPAALTVTGFVGYAPFEGRRRVVVIENAQCMSAQSQNALLKTLEEPPASSLLILTSSAPASLLPTVRSRCQSLRFAPIPASAARQLMQGAYGMPADEARQRAALAPGSVGRALDLDLDAYDSLLAAVVDSLRLAAQGGAGVVAAAETLANLGAGDTATAKAADVLRVARDVLRDLLVVCSGSDRDNVVNVAHMEAWDAWSAELTPGPVTDALDSISAGIDYMTGPIAPNIRMGFEKILFDFADALASRSVGPAT